MAAGIKWSKMVIAPCRVPMQYVASNFCCRTQNVPPTATINFYYKSSYSVKYVATIHQPGCIVSGEGSVTCSHDNNEFVYNLKYSSLYFQNAIGTWGCRYYANESSYTLKEYQVVTDDQGFKMVHPGDRAVLTWITYPSIFLYLKVISPSGLLLLNVSKNNITYIAEKVQFVGNLSVGNVSIQLDNVLDKDNGTYICHITNYKIIGITVVVLKKPLTPIISVDPGSVITSGYKVSSTISCESSSQSAAPMYYNAKIQYNWIIPDSDASYNTNININKLYLYGVDCRMNMSLPVYCAAKEEDEMSYDSEPFYPHDLCSMVPLPSTTPTPAPLEKKQITAFVGLLTFFIIAFVFTLVISLVVGRKRVKKKMKKFYKCCCSCCKDDSDSDDEVILRSTSRSRHRGLEDGLFQENDAHLQSIIDQIVQEESREAREANGPTVNRPPEVFNLFAVQDPNQSNNANENQSSNTPVEDQPDDDSDVNETSEGASNDLQTQGAAAPGVAPVQLLMEVESRLEEFNQSLGEQALQIVVNRDNIVNNLICYYTDPIVPQSRVQVKMFDENGIDAGGITADMYTSFWMKAQEQFFIGCENVVPYLPAHKMVEEENFRVLGSILSHSVALLKTIPIPLCKTTIIVMIYDTLDVAKDTLLKDFLLFIDSYDRNLISKALSNYGSLSEEEQGNLQSIFARYDYAGVIKESNFSEHLVLLARNEICRKPKPLCELMRAGIPSTHMDVFWSLLHPDHLNILYVALKPTATRIIARLHIEGDSSNLSHGQQRAFQYLKNLLNELSPEELENFIQFVTGKRSTPRDPIMVSFTTSRGFQRMPKAHTCSNLLELPATYEDYNAFKNEFKHLLASDEVMIMTME
ncbi:hypothetical protein CHS0354_040427 [Potamilus streckersoni]|uniref:HECT domain-containing protein n=1 Tax=Potamilus streckersoni TaxID=2493646 RepID=A0AAE0T0F8_9BIVA|nr:hypothetical protein CHS0354_040427 [Potamilus streckersoni]